MAHNARKTTKLRGSRTCGYGNTQKHRGAGSRGGRGMAGSNKQNWSFVSKNMKNYFGYKGFKRPQQCQVIQNIINLSDIEKNLKRFMAEENIQENSPITINLTALGYDKLLGSGRITHPVEIIVGAYSETAAKKIESAGGRIQTAENEA